MRTVPVAPAQIPDLTRHAHTAHSVIEEFVEGFVEGFLSVLAEFFWP